MSKTEFHPGDLLGFSGHAWSSAFINLMTYGFPFWSLSHVAIVGEHDGKRFVFESDESPVLPCAVRKVLARGVQVHGIEEKIETYAGKVWHYPLSRRLYPFETRRLNQFLKRYVGADYDNIGAVRSGGLGFSWMESCLREENLSSLFCSEYCAASHREIGLFPTDNVGRWSPNRLIRRERRMGLLLKPRRLK